MAFLDAGLVSMFDFWAIGHEQYLLSALFGLLFAALADPGGSYGHRALRIAVFALIGAGVTALAFGVGADAWGWLVLASFVVTLVAGLVVAFGVRRETDGHSATATSLTSDVGRAGCRARGTGIRASMESQPRLHAFPCLGSRPPGRDPGRGRRLAMGTQAQCNAERRGAFCPLFPFG
ncbi:hypothetical protein [Streptomyces sp. M2CJ-2]|uniref:hypothetical protein n=1 Tax=Streptomyces sp. M2CJ-2 TaxID=2803948 RepID=UPI001F3F7A8C|nr:hypothetical protein [Streptomyces sp. M2CJ-2]